MSLSHRRSRDQPFCLTRVRQERKAPVYRKLESLRSNKNIQYTLDDLHKQSGVILSADAKWIADLPTIAYVDHMPMHLILRRIAQLHNLSWRSEQFSSDSALAGKSIVSKRYVLYESAENRKYINKLKSIQWEPLRRKITAMRAYIQLTSDELKFLAKNGDELAAYLLSQENRANATLVALVSDDVLSELIASRIMSLSYEQLTPEAKKALANIVEAKYERRAKLRDEATIRARALGIQIADPQPAPPVSSFHLQYRIVGEGTNSNLTVLFASEQGAFSGAGVSASEDASNLWISQKSLVSGKSSGLPPSF